MSFSGSLTGFFLGLTLVLAPLQSVLAAEIKLPKPNTKGKLSVEAAMVSKKSVRAFAQAPLTSAQVSQMLWAANGDLPVDAIAEATRKVIPSAGAIYPLEIYLMTGKDTVEGVPAGVYRYNAQNNSLESILEGDNRTQLAYACLGQLFISRAPAVVIIAGAIGRSAAKYGPHGYKYTYMEAGNANQNMYLQAESIGLRMATVGAFHDTQVAAVLKLPPAITPLLVIPIGK